ncbi:MAG TPA: helicase-related protein, partial [Nitrososphaerales archaeon]|nr:helicase-related protein [Nitrososphaerales archaeon]
TPKPEDGDVSREVFTTIDLAARLARMSELISSHKSTLVFVNSRTTAEMLGEKLNRMRGNVGVHHGSLPREERERVEAAFRSGEIKAMVCTSTLELGIDIGAVDLVVQYMSPRQVTSLIQRVGRSGHSLQRLSRESFSPLARTTSWNLPPPCRRPWAGGWKRRSPTRRASTCSPIRSQDI